MKNSKKEDNKPQLLALKASAGSGKTFQLVSRYLSLLYSDANPQNILALTFSKKAAKEMRERVLKALIHISKNPHSPEIAPTIKTIEEYGISRDFVINNSSRIYKKFIFSSPKIVTIDSFFATILKKFSFYAGVSLNYEIKSLDKERIKELFLNELDSRLFLKFVKFMFEDKKSIDSLFDYFESIEEYAKESNFGKKIDFIELGNHKTKLLNTALKIRDNLLCEEMKSRGRNALDYASVEELVEKSKTWASKNSLSEYGDFRRCFEAWMDEDFLELKMELQKYFDLKESYVIENLFEFYSLYSQTKKSEQKIKNYLTFDDISRITYSIINTIDSDFFYFRLDDRIDHLLIDEFQDTSILQYKILEPIIAEIKSGLGRSGFRSLFYVGDVKQSIYRFRGSHSYLFDYASKDVEVKELNINFRSKEEIVGFINELFRDKIDGYFDQKSKNSGGFIEVKNSSLLYEDILDSLNMILSKGASSDDIAILVFKNDDVLNIYEFLKENLKDTPITTETSSKLINRTDIKALISFLNHIYHGDRFYIDEFKVLIGKPLESEIELPKEIKSKKSSEILLFLAEKFEMLSEDTLKLIEIAVDYPKIGELLDYLKSAHIEIPKERQRGIKIMTIHKSKGLEFEHLIVCDRFTPPKNSYHRLMFENRGLELKKIWVRFANRQNVDKEYSKILDSQDSELPREDLLNTLYVALTRAKSSLHIIKKEEKSVFEILELEELQRGELSFRSTQIDRESSKEKRLLASKNHGRQDDFLKKGKEIHSKNFEAIYFGLAIHLVFEYIDLSGKNLDECIEVARNRYGSYIGEKIDEVRRLVSIAIDFGEFKELVAGAKIYKEVPFIYAGKIGRVDMLIEREKEMVIVDFKTSKDDSIEYVEQLSKYKIAFEKFSGKKCRAYLFYIKEQPKLVELTKRQLLLFE